MERVFQWLTTVVGTILTVATAASYALPAKVEQVLGQAGASGEAKVDLLLWVLVAFCALLALTLAGLYGVWQYRRAQKIAVGIRPSKGSLAPLVALALAVAVGAGIQLPRIILRGVDPRELAVYGAWAEFAMTPLGGALYGIALFVVAAALGIAIMKAYEGYLGTRVPSFGAGA